MSFIYTLWVQFAFFFLCEVIPTPVVAILIYSTDVKRIYSTDVNFIVATASSAAGSYYKIYISTVNSLYISAVKFTVK